MALDSDQQSAIESLASSLDASFFKALAEPVRQRILVILLVQGRLNVQQVAKNMVQDRSVISRHLAALELAGLVRRLKVQRYTYYELNGSGIVSRLEELIKKMKTALLVHPES